MISGTRFRLGVELNRQAALAEQIGRAQAQISTGKKLLAPSDDPTASANISQIARAQAEEAAWIANLDSAAALAERADVALHSVAGRVNRAMELIIGAASGTLSAENRNIIASELIGIADEIETVATSLDPRGSPLFKSGDPLLIPVHSGGTISPVASREAIFSSVATAGGLRGVTAIIADAAAAITQTDPAARDSATKVALEEIKAASEHIAAARGKQGVTAYRIQELKERLTLSGMQLTEQRTALEATDLVGVITRLQASQLGLQAAQSVFAKVNQRSLFDLI